VKVGALFLLRGKPAQMETARSLLELSLQSLIYSVPGLRVGDAHTGTTNESGANHWATLCHPMSLGRFGKMIANGFPSVREPRPSSCCLSSRQGDLQQLKVDTDSSR